MSQHIPDWNGDQRRDGVRIIAVKSDPLVITHPDGTEITACPCCGKPLWTVEAAQRLIDKYWPLDTAVVSA